MKLRTTTVRRRFTTLAACSLIATVMPYSAVAEYGIPAGSAAVVTAGQPLLVRTTPGWDAQVSYEIADGSYITVWDVAQTAPDGTLWYPVDGGFLPADGVTSVTTLEGSTADTGFQYFQEAGAEEWVEPAAETQGWVDPNTGEWVEPVAQGWVDPNTGEWVEPAAETTGWVDPNTGEWVEPAAETQGWVDPNTGEWVEPAAETTGWTDSTTGEWVEPAATQGWTDPNTGVWIDPSAVQGYIDPNTGTWVDPAAGGYVHPTTGEWVQTGSVAQEATTEEWVEPAAETTGWVDPNTGEWVEPAAETTGWVDPNTGEWVEPAVQGWVDPNTGEWVEPAAETQGWVDPNTGEWVDPVSLEQKAQKASAEEWVEPAPVETSASGDPWGEPIGTAYISATRGDGVACRIAAEPGSEKLAIIGEGEAVEVRGEAIGQWQPVNCAGMGGYVNTAYISWEPAATDDGSGRRGRNSSVGNGAGYGEGQAMVNFAMQYVGYPYAYAGEGPYAFDCSGFTKFVAQNTIGMDITHDMFTQIGMGQSVNKGQLQPGDLVFFANTFRPGLSHVGIYIGGGQFVHAENESTGVVVSDLNSDYYGSRWAGGTRLA